MPSEVGQRRDAQQRYRNLQLVRWSDRPTQRKAVGNRIGSGCFPGYAKQFLDVEGGGVDRRNRPPVSIFVVVPFRVLLSPNLLTVK